MVREEFRVELVKESLTFSAAHFITFDGNICERLHGHNWRVRAEVTGPLDENHYVVDFIRLRDALMQIVGELDHRVLLPADHALIQVEQKGDEVEARFQQRRWIFPQEDCRILPVANTTAEQLARWIAQQLIDRKLFPAARYLEVGVDENQGQWGICRVDLLQRKQPDETDESGSITGG
jgi:6-pyruvoyltetrahydropterin/6-carboxytetrahydropterin synthase